MLVPEDLKDRVDQLIRHHSSWKYDCGKFVSTFGEMMHSDSDLADAAEFRYADKTLRKSENALEVRFQALVDDLTSLLQPVFGSNSNVSELLEKFAAGVEDTSEQDPSPPLSTKNKAVSKKAAGKGPAKQAPKSDGPPKVILLVDRKLMSLPIEALPVFCSFRGRTTRDFSVHLLGHRLTAFGSSAQVSSSTVRLMCDPLGDDNGFHQQGIDRPSLRETCQTLLKGPNEIPGSKKWNVVNIGKGPASIQNFIGFANVLNKKSPHAVCLCSTGKIGSTVNPMELASINWENVALLVSSDMSANDTSYRRQLAVDNLKQSFEVDREDQLRVCALLSLAGIGAVVSNQWGVTFASQQRFLQQYWTSFARNAQSSEACVGVDGEDQQRDIKIKPWIRYARAYYGLNNVTYSDS